MHAKHPFRMALAAVLVVSASAAQGAEIESLLAHGGRLYDNWYKELKTTRPEDPNPAYTGKSAKNSWRCIACHGWDYSGEKSLGIKGITGAKGKPEAFIVAILRDKTHNYGPDKLADADANALAMFVSKGQIDMSLYIDPTSGQSKGDAAKGEVYFNTLCAVCHGLDGKKVSTGMALGQAADYPAAMLHKALNGQPAEAMPMLRSFDHAISAHIVAYAKTLPK